MRRYLEGIEEIDDRIRCVEWNLTETIAECRSIEKRGETFLHDSNLLLAMAYDRHARILVSLKEFGKSALFFQQSLPAFRYIGNSFCNAHYQSINQSINQRINTVNPGQSINQSIRFFRRKLYHPQDTKIAVQVLLAGLSTFLADAFHESAAYFEEATELLRICDGVDRPLFDLALVLSDFSSAHDNENVSEPKEFSNLQTLSQSAIVLLTNVRTDYSFHFLEQRVKTCLTNAKNHRNIRWTRNKAPESNFILTTRIPPQDLQEASNFFLINITLLQQEKKIIHNRKKTITVSSQSINQLINQSID